ncbi:PH domain-containing protein [Blastopirellula marina]|nr:PH domain-containing protein [Blastopirellula marina]
MDKDDFTNKMKPRDDSRRDDPEEQLWSGNYSAKDMYGSWIITGVLSIAALAVACVFFWAVPVVLGVIGVVALIWIALLFRLMWRKWSVQYELTTQRFVHQKGVLSRTTDRIEVIDIDDVTFTQSIFDRMFGVGTITVTSSDRTHPTLVLDGIEDVKYVADLIDGARRKERIRRGIHIEAI